MFIELTVCNKLYLLNVQKIVSISNYKDERYPNSHCYISFSGDDGTLDIRADQTYEEVKHLLEQATGGYGFMSFKNNIKER